MENKNPVAHVYNLKKKVLYLNKDKTHHIFSLNLKHCHYKKKLFNINSHGLLR